MKLNETITVHELLTGRIHKFSNFGEMGRHYHVSSSEFYKKRKYEIEHDSNHFDYFIGKAFPLSVYFNPNNEGEVK